MTLGPCVVIAWSAPLPCMVAVVDRFFQTIVGSAVVSLATPSMISVSRATPDGAGAVNAPAVHVMDPSGLRTAVQLPAVATGSLNDMPSTGGIVTVTVPAATTLAVLLVSRSVSGKVSPGLPQTRDDTNE